jgi:murein DD-endopeptidase MepM/ murein hydrolase activator NlpD
MKFLHNTKNVFRVSAVTLMLGLVALSDSALALPKAAPVPGGLALIKLGAVSTQANTPQVWFGDRRVLVTADAGQWIAIVGLPLDLPVGSQELQVGEGAAKKTVRFEVKNKHYPEQHITLKNNSRVNLSPADEERATREIAAIGELKRHWRETGDTDTDFQLPAEGRLASRFGLRRFFNGEPRAPHSGLDVAVPRGTPIKAAAHGKVLATGNYFFNGNTVFVDHGNGLITMYCHLDRIDVQTGDTIAQGQPLGLAGATGRASGPHLHWSVALNGTMVDPELFLAAKQKIR